MKRAVMEMLEKYGHNVSDDGVATILEEHERQKAPILSLLKGHPRYDPDRMAVVLDGEWTAPTDPHAAGVFITWLYAQSTYTDAKQKLDAWEELRWDVQNAVSSTDTGSAVVSEEIVDDIRLIDPDIKVVAGQKLSRAINKLCAAFSLDTQKAGSIEASKYADFASACTCTKTVRTTVISINPLDYLTMSFGHGWRSCHTIDRENIRGTNGQGHGGCYCSGTLSYMMDGASVVCFTVKDEAAAYDYDADKYDRCMMHVSADGGTFVQGRCYPQDNDSEDGIYKQYRQLMQSVLSTCTDTASLWMVKKGTAAVRDIVETVSGSTHYTDYTHFDNCNYSVIKGTTPAVIRIGHMPLCPCCGNAHREEKSLCCGRCEENYEYYCEYCGDGIREDDIYDEAVAVENGEVYCCYDCAYAAGWRRDEYDGEWFYYSDGYDVNGSWYRSYENAEMDGWRCDCDGDWYPEDEVRYCEYCDRDIHISFWDTSDGDYCYQCEEEIEEERQAEEAERIRQRAAVYDANIQYYLTYEDRQRGEYVNIFTGEVNPIPARAAAVHMVPRAAAAA